MRTRFQYLKGLATVVLATPATADVIYSNLRNIAIPATYDGVYLNVENGASNTDMDNPIDGWDINPFFGGSVLWNSPSFQPVRSADGSMTSVLNLAVGTIVDTNRVFSTVLQGPAGATPNTPSYGGSDSHLGPNPGQFVAGDVGYLGFKLNGANHGWMRVIFTDNAGGAMIKDWAYDNSGASIARDNIVHNGSDVTLDSTLGAFTVGSEIANSFGTTNLVKTGANSANLGGINSYTGTTQVSVGRLNVNGSLHAASAVTVDAGATLGGDGLISGNVSLTGILRPGQGGVTDRTLNIAGALTANPGSSVLFNIAGEGSGNHDQLMVGGSLNLNNMELGIESFTDTSITELGLNQGPSFLTSGASFYKLIDGATTGMFSNVTETMSAAELDHFGLSGSQFTYQVGDQKFWVAAGSTYLVAIPEPGAAMLGGLGLLGLLRRRRRD